MIEGSTIKDCMSIYERDPLTVTAAAALGEVTPVTSQSGCGMWV